jgi:hypothetical protein
MLNLCTFSLKFTYLHACINLITYSLNTVRIGIYGWVELLSPAVMSYRTSLPSFMMLSLTYGLVLKVLVFRPS